jgi:hypothetical protein
MALTHERIRQLIRHQAQSIQHDHGGREREGNVNDSPHERDEVVQPEED